MPITLSAEAAAKAERIPEFSARLERFIDDQFELEAWRGRRSQVEVAAIVAEGLEQANALRGSNAVRNELFARLAALTERLANGR
jgi:hypothetical protein